MDSRVVLENTHQIDAKIKRKHYISVFAKFYLSHIFAIIWVIFSIFISLHWVQELSSIVTLPVAIFIIGGLAYIPGYLNAFLVISLIIDRQPAYKSEWPEREVTILIAARNEAERITDTLKYIAGQDYSGKIKVMVVDNGSADGSKSMYSGGLT